MMICGPDPKMRFVVGALLNQTNSCPQRVSTFNVDRNFFQEEISFQTWEAFFSCQNCLCLILFPRTQTRDNYAELLILLENICFFSFFIYFNLISLM